MDDERFCFVVEWYEELAARTREFQLFFYVNSKAVEMYDLKTRKTFLRTSVKDSDLTLADMYIGNNITVCSRLLTIIDYGDEYTRRKLSSTKETTLAMLKPGNIEKLGEIVDIIYQRGFLITNMRMQQMERKHAIEFYTEHTSAPYFNALLDSITADPIVVFEILGENAISAWREMIGPTNPVEARKVAPNSLRARFGRDAMFNVVHGAKNPQAAAREIEFFFGPSKRTHCHNNPATVGNCTCCIIKPSAIKAGHAGKIMCEIIRAGFKIGAVQMYTLEKANAEEFCEVYKGVVHEYPDMIVEFTNGCLIAMELTAPKDAPNIVPQFRELCGPSDPEIAKHLRPHTLRARYGKDRAKNAVHCTDLPDDGQLEVEYFFRILNR